MLGFIFFYIQTQHVTGISPFTLWGRTAANLVMRF